MTQPKETKHISTDIDSEFEAQISLPKLIGHRHAVQAAQAYIESYYADLSSGRNPRLNPILLIGNSGGRTMARAIHNSFAGLEFRVASALWMNSKLQEINYFFSQGDQHTTYYIVDADRMDSAVQYGLFNILYEKQISIFNMEEQTKVEFQNRLIILSAPKLPSFNTLLMGRIGLKLNLGKLSKTEVEAVIKQRLSFLNWPYNSDKVIEIVAQQGLNDVGKALDVLALSYSIMRSQGHDCMTEEFVSQAAHIVSENVRAGSRLP